MDYIISIPKEVAEVKLGKTKLITLLKQMGAEVVDNKTSQKREVSSDAKVLFAYHQQILGEHFPIGLRATPERMKIINARLDRFTLDQLKQIVDYVARSPFHLGQNDAKKKYLDISNIIGNDTKVERKLNELAEKKQVYESIPEIRLTLQGLGAKIRAGQADYLSKEKFQKLVGELREQTGETYNWRDDTFTK